MIDKTRRGTETRIGGYGTVLRHCRRICRESGGSRVYTPKRFGGVHPNG